VIDDHAHPFPLNTDRFDPAGITLDIAPGGAADARRRELGPRRLATEMMLVRLAGRLGCSVGDVTAARQDAASDWPAYVRGLFSDVGITGMLIDPGAEAFPTEAGVSPYADVADLPMWDLVRIDPLVDRLIGAGATAQEIVQSVEEQLASRAAHGAVGAKTVLAYRTGLAVDPRADLAAADVSLRSDLPVRRRGKALRDLVFRRVLACCTDLGLPLQVHTGFGDSDIRLRDADPLLLEEVLRTAEGEAASVVLLHGGFPWHEQVAYLASTRPRVWVDFSLSDLVSPATTADRLLRLIDLAPTSRLLLGSDGHGAPETHWFAVGTLRDAWSVVRGRLGAVARAEWLDDAEHALFSSNAQQLYGL
jgi:predicted TIM-barrel fold metal-dependent hydrolase